MRKTSMLCLVFALVEFSFANEPALSPVKETGSHAKFTSTAYKGQPTVHAEAYEEFVGQYQMNPKKVLTITKEGDQLFGQPTGEGKLELHPVSDVKFKLKEIGATLTFIKNRKGEVIEAFIELKKKSIHAKRIDPKKAG